MFALARPLLSRLFTKERCGLLVKQVAGAIVEPFAQVVDRINRRVRFPMINRYAEKGPGARLSRLQAAGNRNATEAIIPATLGIAMS